MVSNRVTTNMVMRNYQNNLNASMGGLELSRKQVETGMRFTEAYEDPASAAKAAILERRYAQNESYLSIAENMQNWIYAQEDVASTLTEAAREIVENYSTSAVSDTNASVRPTYAELFRNMQESMVQTLNTQYANTFVMGGNNGNEVPFELTDQGLTYRGVLVSSTDPKDQEVLKELSQENSFVNLGFGLVDENGNVTEATAFDTAFPGINLVGFGVTEVKDENGNPITDEDGNPITVPNNIIDLAGKMAEMLEADNFDSEGYGHLWDQFHESFNEMTNQFTAVGTKEKLLETTIDRLEDEKIAITEQYNTTINIDPAEAITNYSWAMYVYNTSLKVGTSIISPSLLDFMK